VIFPLIGYALAAMAILRTAVDPLSCIAELPPPFTGSIAEAYQMIKNNERFVKRKDITKKNDGESEKRRKQKKRG